jgi:hypothetical protein
VPVFRRADPTSDLPELVVDHPLAQPEPQQEREQERAPRTAGKHAKRSKPKD